MEEVLCWDGQEVGGWGELGLIRVSQGNKADKTKEDLCLHHSVATSVLN